MATILWCVTEYKGPVNGMLEYRGEKLWFQRLDNQTYQLLRISDDLHDLLWENQQRRCAASGRPLRHGDPYTINKPQMVRTKAMNLEVDEEIEMDLGKKTAVTQVVTYVHTVNPFDIKGEEVCIIDKSTITNLYPNTAFIYK